MLKLRYLFDNRPLAELLRAGWDTDPEQLPGFRISSNAIYPFMSGGEVSFLRFAPTSEKRVAQVEAELDFIGHLRRAGYGAPEPIPARDGRLVVTEETPWGAYLATAFRKVPGTQLDRGDIDDRIATSYGQALAELHRLSSDHSPTGSRRWSHADALDWMRSELAGLPDTAAALGEADLIGAALAGMPRTEATYGLVHYDFECDNVFFDAPTGRCFAIDFDDAMYHWFAMDIEQALHSLAREVDAAVAPGRERAFLLGYAAVRPLPEDIGQLRIVCRRFADLYRYARVRRSVDERLLDEPDWMVDLREQLADRLAAWAETFGTPLA